jgi:predicted protein tyrosine phosphatase
MINSVTITDLSTAVSLSFKGCAQNVWISTVDEEDENKIRMMRGNLCKRNVKHFAQYFYDWSDEDSELYIQKNIEQKGPREQHVNNIISFLQPIVESDKVYNLGINCFAGISRSTAIGIIAWVMQGKTPQEALDEIIKVRYQAWPNLRILRFASARLGKDLVYPVKTWKAQEAQSIFIPKAAPLGILPLDI